MTNWKIGDRLVVEIAGMLYHGLIESVTFATWGPGMGRTDIPFLKIRFDNGHSFTARADDQRLIRMCS